MKFAIRLMGFAAALLTQSVAQAQEANTFRIETPQRLSQWLESHPMASDSYPLGMMWRTPEELVRQTTEQSALRQEIKILQQSGRLNETEATALDRMLVVLQPTGRVRTHAAESRWLEASPKKDPLLRANDSLQLPSRSNMVRVLTSEGAACELLHKEGLYAKDYAQACFEKTGAWGWLVQPDARVQKVGLEAWNIQKQDQPAPGAWIWLPTNKALDDAFNARWAAWLSYQGVASNVGLDLFEPFHRQITPAVEPISAFDTAGKNLIPRATASDWGNAGLLQTPTARMHEEGYFGLGLHRVHPYEQVSLMFQPTPWMETGFRYTSISNRLYSPYASWSGDQSYKDKSIDLKLRALKEDDWLPELSVGLRDMGGTGLFSSEYVVASKRAGSLDFSVGLGWGYLGGRGNLKNPLSKLMGQAFDVRESDVGQGGKFAGKSWFHGPAALFGGVAYQSPWDVVFKLEYDGNNYKKEPLGNAFEVKRPFNLGVVYTGWKGFDVHAGVERGNTFSVGFTMFTDLSGLNVPKVTDPPLPRISQDRPSVSPNWGATARDIEKHTQWQVDQIYVNDNKLVVEAARSNNPYPSVRLDKAMTIVHRDAPANIEQVEVQHKVLNTVLAVETVNREEWVAAQTQPARTNELPVPKQPAYQTQSVPGTSTGQPTLPEKTTNFYFDPGLDLIQTLGGPDGFVLYQFSLALRTGLKLPEGFEAKSLVRQRLVNNYDRFRDGGSSSMPRVRTHMREYFVTSATTLTNLTINKTARATDNLYWGVYGGYFEEMFGGVGAEALYRQPGSRWALGVDVNKVKQRDFAQDFGFRDYQVQTGHVTGYWMTPIEGVSTSLAYGQYLAGDRGATLTVSKTFSNGSVMGAYATKTNVPAEVFGEGSFDKGVFWSIPFDAFLTSSSRSTASFSWKPLTRDGGAKLIRPVNLFQETVWLNPEVNRFKPAHPGNDRVAPDDRVDPRY
jgi:hypothetical protein